METRKKVVNMGEKSFAGNEGIDLAEWVKEIQDNLAECFQEFQDLLSTRALSWEALSQRDPFGLQASVVHQGKALRGELEARGRTIDDLLKCSVEELGSIFVKVSEASNRAKLNKVLSLLSVVLGGKSTFKSVRPEEGLDQNLLSRIVGLVSTDTNEDEGEAKLVEDTILLYAGIIGSAGKHSVLISEYVLKCHYLTAVSEAYSVLLKTAPLTGGTIERLLATTPHRLSTAAMAAPHDGKSPPSSELSLAEKVESLKVAHAPGVSKDSKKIPPAGNKLARRGSEKQMRAAVRYEHKLLVEKETRDAHSNDYELESVSRDFEMFSETHDHYDDESPSSTDSPDEYEIDLKPAFSYMLPKPVIGQVGSPARYQVRRAVSTVAQTAIGPVSSTFFRKNSAKDAWTNGKKLNSVVQLAFDRAISSVKLSLEQMHTSMAGRSSLVMFTLQGPLIDLSRTDAKFNSTSQKYQNLTHRSPKDLLRAPICNPDQADDLERVPLERMYLYYPLHSTNHLAAFLTSQMDQAHYLEESPVAFLRNFTGRDLAGHLSEFKLGMNQIVQGYCQSDADKGHITKWAYFARFFLTMWNRAFALGSFAEFSAVALTQEFGFGGFNRDPSTIPEAQRGPELVAALRMLHCVCPVCFEWGSTLSFCNNCMFATTPPKRPFVLIQAASNGDAFSPDQSARYAAYKAFTKANPTSKLSLEEWRVQENLPAIPKPISSGFVSFDAAATALALRQDLIRDAFVSVSPDPKELVL